MMLHSIYVVAISIRRHHTELGLRVCFPAAFCQPRGQGARLVAIIDTFAKFLAAILQALLDPPPTGRHSPYGQFVPPTHGVGLRGAGLAEQKVGIGNTLVVPLLLEGNLLKDRRIGLLDVELVAPRPLGGVGLETAGAAVVLTRFEEPGFLFGRLPHGLQGIAVVPGRILFGGRVVLEVKDIADSIVFIVLDAKGDG